MRPRRRRIIGNRPAHVPSTAGPVTFHSKSTLAIESYGAHTWEHTCDDDDLLVVTLSTFDFEANDPVSVEYGGHALTQAAKSVQSGVQSFIYILTSPPNGPHFVTVTYAEGALRTTYANGMSLTFRGVDVTDPVKESFENNDYTNAASVGPITPSSGDMSVDVVAMYPDWSYNQVPGAGQTDLYDWGLEYIGGFLSSYKEEADALTWAWTVDNTWSQAAIQIRPG